MKERLIKMCQPSTETLIVPSTNAYSTTTNSNNITTEEDEDKVPIESVVPAPSFAARYACTSVLVGIFAIWSKFTFVPESEFPGGMTEMHSWIVPAGFTVFYLLSLPLLRYLSREYLTVDVKVLLRECMILYNAAQVLLNGWMVYRFLDALLWNGHPFISAPVDLVTSGASYAVWLHYCDKYLEFLDTYFMVLRGKMDQVSFLHVYHHISISWAWWIGLRVYPGGDIYFGALLNSWIHVMMYSYYALSLLKIRCPWKKYLTMAQLAQFLSVLIYSAVSIINMPVEANWKHYAAYCTQVFEMTSLFVLFMHFYRKAYSDKQKQPKQMTASDNDSTSAACSSVSSESSEDAPSTDS